MRFELPNYLKYSSFGLPLNLLIYFYRGIRRAINEIHIARCAITYSLILVLK